MITTYHHGHDESLVWECWQAALGDTWPITPESLRVMLTSERPGKAGPHIVARHNDGVVGFALLQFQEESPYMPQPIGNITALAVTPAAQRQGLGTQLVEAALNQLRELGAVQVQLGGRVPRFWPGVPTNLPGAIAFFEQQGFTFGDRVDWDVVRSLRDYTIDPQIAARIAQENLQIAPGSAEDMPEVQDFLTREFPGWHSEYAHPIALGDYFDVLVARDPGQGVVGTLLMYGPGSHEKRADTMWKARLGENAGGMNAVGVAANQRGRGIGIALVARGAEILKARGADQTLIGWTSIVDFYAKVGFQPWQEYRMCFQSL